MKKEVLAVLTPLFLACMFTSLPLLIMAYENNPIFNKDSIVWNCWTDKDEAWIEYIHIVLEQTSEENSKAVVGIGCKYVEVAEPEKKRTHEQCNLNYQNKYKKWKNNRGREPKRHCTREELNRDYSRRTDTHIIYDSDKCESDKRKEWERWHNFGKYEPENTCGEYEPKKMLQCRHKDTNANFKKDDDLGIDKIWTFADGRTAVMKPDNTVLYYKNSGFPTEIFWYCQ